MKTRWGNWTLYAYVCSVDICVLGLFLIGIVMAFAICTYGYYNWMDVVGRMINDYPN